MTSFGRVAILMSALAGIAALLLAGALVDRIGVFLTAREEARSSMSRAHALAAEAVESLSSLEQRRDKMHAEKVLGLAASDADAIGALRALLTEAAQRGVTEEAFRASPAHLEGRNRFVDAHVALAAPAGEIMRLLESIERAGGGTLQALQIRRRPRGAGAGVATSHLDVQLSVRFMLAESRTIP